MSVWFRGVYIMLLLKLSKIQIVHFAENKYLERDQSDDAIHYLYSLSHAHTHITADRLYSTPLFIAMDFNRLNYVLIFIL